VNGKFAKREKGEGVRYYEVDRLNRPQTPVSIPFGGAGSKHSYDSRNYLSHSAVVLLFYIYFGPSQKSWKSFRVLR
jgi:hypothetical protein